MEITIQYIISQIFTIASYTLLGATYHSKNRKSVLILNFLSQMAFASAYIFLGAWSGLAMTIVGLARNAIFIIDENKNGKREKINKLDIAVLVGVYIISIVLGIFTYEGIFSLLPILANILYTYAVCQKNIKIYKFLGAPIETIWVCYNIYIKSVFGIILEIIMIISSFIGYRMEIKKDKNSN